MFLCTVYLETPISPHSQVWSLFVSRPIKLFPSFISASGPCDWDILGTIRTLVSAKGDRPRANRWLNTSRHCVKGDRRCEGLIDGSESEVYDGRRRTRFGASRDESQSLGEYHVLCPTALGSACSDSYSWETQDDTTKADEQFLHLNYLADT